MIATQFSATVLSPRLCGWQFVLYLLAIPAIITGFLWLFTGRDPDKSESPDERRGPVHRHLRIGHSEDQAPDRPHVRAPLRFSPEVKRISRRDAEKLRGKEKKLGPAFAGMQGRFLILQDTIGRRPTATRIPEARDAGFFHA
jgi:hypothetical protein